MKLKSRLPVLIGLVAVLLTGPASVYAQQATLKWEANTEPDVTGYRVYYGTRSGTYLPPIDVGKVTTYTVSGLDVSLDYFFAVQAYASTGLSSALSAEVELAALVAPGTTVINSFTANSGFPLVAGQPAVTWTANATSKRGAVEYQFVKYSSKNGWQVIQPYSRVSSATWAPTWNDIGTHTMQVWARTIGSPIAYEAWVGMPPFSVNAAAVQITADVDFPTPPDNPVHWTASVAGASALSLEYRFLLLNQGTGAWSVLRDYGSSSQATWTPSATGNYMLQVWARRTGTTAVYDVWGQTPVLKVSKTPLQVTSLAADQTFPAPTGTPITWTARVRGGTAGPIQYQFVRESSAGWQIVKPYSSSNTYSWTPSWNQAGSYNLQVWVRNGVAATLYDSWGGVPPFDITQAPLDLSTKQAFPVPPGTAVSWSAQVADTSASFEYQYILYTQSTGTWAVVRPYSTTKTFTWSPSTTGTYLLQAWARRVGSSAPYELWASSGYLTVSKGPAQVLSIDANVSLPVNAGTSITWTVKASGGTAAPLEYRFLLYTEGAGWTILRDYAASNTLTWKPDSTDVGTHLLQVWVRSAGSSQPYEGYRGTEYFLIYP